MNLMAIGPENENDLGGLSYEHEHVKIRLPVSSTNAIVTQVHRTRLMDTLSSCVCQ